MDIGCWSLIISLLGLFATIGLGCYFYWLTTKNTEEIKEFLTTLIVNSSPDPKALQRLLDDRQKTGHWRGKVEQTPGTTSYHIAWTP